MSIFDKFYAKNTTPFNIKNLPVKEVYEKLQEYYDNNGLYSKIETGSYLNNKWVEAMKPLRTSVNRSVEFYVSRLCQEKINIVSDNQKASDAISQFLKWSNFESQKRTLIRDLALFGDLFLKVVSTKDKVYLEPIEPKFVTDFTTDYRGYLTSIRIDIPMTDDNGQPYTYTEYWTKEYFATWNHHYNDSTKIEDLGTPNQYIWLNQMGINFVPIVWIPFRKVSGKSRGESCVSHAIDKIDEANRITTRLHQILYKNNKTIWAIQHNGTDNKGRPLPAPLTKDDDTDLLSNDMVKLPGNSELVSLVPNINYDSALNIVNAMLDEIEKDLPELRYFSSKDNESSGKALRILLSPAIDRANECKANFLAGLERLNEMALTIGQYMGVFSGIGSYENGDFNHTVDMGEIFPKDTDDKAGTLKTLTDAGVPLAVAMKLAGFDKDTTKEASDLKQVENQQAMGQLVNSLNQG